MTLDIRDGVPLAPLTTLGVGGSARHFVEVESHADAREALEWAAARGLKVEVLGGGSNVLVADRGVDGLVLRYRDERIAVQDDGEDGVVEVGAGKCWDELVAWAVSEDLAGFECLSGIPGDVGAAPMQNVGAYGQEVSETIQAVQVIDRKSGEASALDAEACQFGYRDSIFKREAAGRYLVTSVTFRLRRRGAAKLVYAELRRELGLPVPSTPPSASSPPPPAYPRKRQPTEPSLSEVRDTVLRLRRAKSMVIDSGDENCHSAGSFFVNPIVTREELERVELLAREVMAPGDTLPYWSVGDGRVKLAAAWLIERAGMSKGTVRGRVGISTKHSLAIVNRGGASAAELVAFACEVRELVYERFGVTLHHEPRLVGFEPDAIAGLVG